MPPCYPSGPHCGSAAPELRVPDGDTLPRYVCGACGTKCALAHATAGCSRGCYLAACDFGFDDCNADPMDGIEADDVALRIATAVFVRDD